MNCRILRRRRAHLRGPETAAAAGEFAPSGHAQVAANEKANPSIAAQLRAQIPGSTDPQRLAKLASDGESAARACSLRPANLLRLRGQLGGSRFMRHRDLDKCGGTHSAKASPLS